MACGCMKCSACLDGTTSLTPLPVWNRPGLDALRDRVGTHGAFLETMKARLSTMLVDVPNPDGETHTTLRPLAPLTTRDPSDPAIALLDGWATVADVLTFYQERITNESYLRTAAERASLVALGRTVGYAPRPGVAASTFLWYTIDDAQTDPVIIPAGTRAQSIPGPGEFPQSFETSDPIEARAEWNALAVRQTRPQVITLSSVLSVDTIHLAGTPNLKTGDTLLFAFDPEGQQAAIRTVASVESPFGSNRTIARLAPLPPLMLGAMALLQTLVAGAKALPSGDPYSNTPDIILRAEGILSEIWLGGSLPPRKWIRFITYGDDGDADPDMQALLDAFEAALEDLIKSGTTPPPPVQASPDTFVESLLIPPAAQPASGQRLGRDLKSSFAANRDTGPRLLIDLVPQLRRGFYKAWTNAAVVTADPPLKALHVMRASGAPFGATAPFVQKYEDGELQPPNEWTDWPLDGAEESDVLFLDAASDAVLPDSYVLAVGSGLGDARRVVRRVIQAEPVTRAAYGIAGKTTKLTLSQDWWVADKNQLSTLRGIAVRYQSEALTLDQAVIADPIASETIELAGLYKELQPGRWLVIAGERADIPGVTGVKGSELAMLSGLTHGYDASLPGDVTHTTLLLATKPAYAYKRDTVVISANVARATHGETRMETLGAGDATKPFQSFGLKQPPLTFTAAISAAGVASTLQVLVDDVAWDETDTLVDLGPKDRRFVTRIAESGAVTVTFGDGATGARTPTGVENIRAVYRQGIGKQGNVKAEQVALLLSRPAGVRSVINPLPASGGADPDAADLIRQNAPLAVAALDRVVSVRDYADFARGFAGIAKAEARQVSDGTRQYIHVTVAGVDDIPIDTNSDLFNALVGSLRALGDPALPLIVAPRERITLVLAAGIKLRRGYQWESVDAAIRAALLDRFGFARRTLGQPAVTSVVISAIQGIPGVDYVDLDSFGGVPERVANPDGTRRLLTLGEISATVSQIVTPTGVPWGETTQTLAAKGPPRAISAAVAGMEKGAIRPAQLAIFTPAVPDTIALNQIL